MSTSVHGTDGKIFGSYDRIIALVLGTFSLKNCGQWAALTSVNGKTYKVL